MTALEIRLAFYGAILALIACVLLYERHAGEAKIRAEDKAAAEAQHERDLATNQGTIHALQADNDHLRELASRPPPVVRVCLPTRLVSTGPAPAGTQPAVAGEAGTGASGVPAGANGIDIGPALSNLRWSTAVISDYRDRTWEWSVKQAKKP